MGRGGTATATTAEETATGIAMTTGTAETMTEEVGSSVHFSTLTHLHYHLSPTLFFFNGPGFDSRGGGGGRRAFGSGFRRDYDDSRGSGERYGDRDRYGERDRYNDRDDRYERRDERREERGNV